MELIGYTRVSTDDQSDDLQREALIRHGVKPEMIWSDKMTGARMDRPGLKRALKVARKGDKLVVWKLDRLGRSTIGVLDAIETMTKRGIELESVTEKLDSATPLGRLVISFLASFSQMERELIAERTKAGIAAARARGVRMGRKHFVLDYPKRLAKWREIWPMVADRRLEGKDVIRIMNEADLSAPRVKRPQSFYNWRAKGFEGWQQDEPLGVPCCICGSPVDTREIYEGGGPDGAQLADGRWACCSEHWHQAAETA